MLSFSPSKPKPAVFHTRSHASTSTQHPCTSRLSLRPQSYVNYSDGISDFFMDNEPTGTTTTISAPSAEPVLAPLHPVQRQSHQRALTDAGQVTCFLPPLVTTRIEVQSSPVPSSTLTQSVFSSSKDIDFQFSPPQTPQISPLREKWSFFSSSPSENLNHSKPERRGIDLAEWFQGQSELVSIGVPSSPTKEKTNPMAISNDAKTPLPPSMHNRQSAQTSISRPTSSSPSRFSFFGSKASTASVRQPASPDDVFANLDIKSALLAGVAADSVSASSFKTLLQNAEGLVSRMREAYKGKTATLRDTAAENEVQAEELEEAQTRARHLKMQLDETTAKLAEQDAAMMDLVDELVKQKQWRQEEEASRKRSVRLVAGDEGSIPTTYRARVQRLSQASTIPDSGIESDDESPAASVFSVGGLDHLSAANSIATSPSIASTADFHDYTGSRQDMTSARGTPKISFLMIDRMKAAGPTLVNETRRCLACGQVDADEAWSAVSALKDVNMGLTRRVGELEETIDGCLELVAGMGAS